jgi:RND family efflux transporter MFP subunit
MYNKSISVIKKLLINKEDIKTLFGKNGIPIGFTKNYLQSNRKNLFTIFIIIAVIFILSDFFSSTESGNIPTFKVKKNNFLVSLTESGEIYAKDAVSISTPRVRGNLKIVYLIPQGTYVKAGDTVVAFDPTEAISQMKDAEAKLEIAISNKDKLIANQKSQLTNAESNLKGAELSFELSKLNLEQMKFEAEVKQQEAKLQHQKNELALKKAKQDVESQKIVHQSELANVNIDVQQKKSDLDRAKRELELLFLIAPREGLVVYETNWATGRKIALGDTPWPGMNIITLPDLSQMQSQTYVNEVDVSKVRKGQKVFVKLDAFPDSTFIGVIGNVASLGKSKDLNSSIKVFEIIVEIKSRSEILKPGMSTSNKIIINEIPNVLFIPQEAVFEKHNKKVIYIKNGSSFEEKEVELGDKSEDYIIIKNGLRENEEIALRDPTINIDKLDEQDESETINIPSSKGTQEQSPTRRIIVR